MGKRSIVYCLNDIFVNIANNGSNEEKEKAILNLIR
jgi:hypothetical protein